MMILILFILALGLFSGWLIWGNGIAVLKNPHQGLYWILPVFGLMSGLALTLSVISSRDSWDEAIIFIVLGGGFWIPLTLIIPFIGHKLKPNYIWGWVGSIIGLPAGYVIGTLIGAVLSFIFGSGF
ncbi:MAG: hypothetical protein OSB62_00110 [Alphaproteobacteria bacterium]|nr:hypothetical protein [Alphaproteobacteria bacterium]